MVAKTSNMPYRLMTSVDTLRSFEKTNEFFLHLPSDDEALAKGARVLSQAGVGTSGQEN